MVFLVLFAQSCGIIGIISFIWCIDMKDWIQGTSTSMTIKRSVMKTQQPARIAKLMNEEERQAAKDKDTEGKSTIAGAGMPWYAATSFGTPQSHQ